MTIKTLLFTIFSLAMVAAVHGMAFRGSNQHVPSTFNNIIESNGDNECVACQLIYSGVVGTVKIQNATVAELEKVSKEVCDLRISNFTAPDAVHEVCDYVLKDITKVRVAIVNKVAADNFCEDANFCDNNEEVHSEEERRRR